MSEPTPFSLAVGEDVLQDLRQRLDRVRWPDEAPDGEPWTYGTDLSYLREFVSYWREDFDWPAQQERFNAFPQYTAKVAGIDLHFLHVPGNGPRPMPLLLSHGWPGSVWEFHKIIPMLTDPARFGGDPDDAFTVVAPSLPGYTLSFRPGQRRFSHADIAAAFVELMRDVLGYQGFLAQGGDWGAFVSAYIAYSEPSAVSGIHINLLPLRREPPPPEVSESPEMQAYLREVQHWLREETGYSTIQGTKPQTLAYALTDSPVGLAAWILEKFRTWSDCDGTCRGASRATISSSTSCSTGSQAPSAAHSGRTTVDSTQGGRYRPNSRWPCRRPTRRFPRTSCIRRARWPSAHSTFSAGPKPTAAATSRRSKSLSSWRTMYVRLRAPSADDRSIRR